jgi:hypothetical protein
MDVQLDIAFFESRLNSRFQVTEGPVELTLVECKSLPAHKGSIREPFSLTFRGPVEVFLPQRMYELRNEQTEPVAIFLVPVGRDAAGFLYEAIFN